VERLSRLLNQAVVRETVSELLQDRIATNFRGRGAAAEAELRNKVLPALGQFPLVTVEDLLEAIFSSSGAQLGDRVTHSPTGIWVEAAKLPVANPENRPALFARFCDALYALANHHWFSESQSVGPRTSSDWSTDHPTAIWESSDGAFSISLVGRLPAGGEADYLRLEGSLGVQTHAMRFYAQVFGVCSRRFFDDFCREAMAALSCILRCIEDHFEAACRELLDGVNRCSVDELATLYNQATKILDIAGGGDEFAMSDEGTMERAPRGERLPYDSLVFIRDAMAAYFEELSNKKDSVARRVRNAMRLMVESHNQSHNAIGLALSVTAIEALLCCKGENLAQMFAENVAALLEPDTKCRFEAERWAKRLYDLRSGVLHGTELNCPPEDIRNAQVAAGMVLRAILERRAAIKRVQGNDENPDDFFRELRSGKYRRGQVTHVSEMPLKRFWRMDAPKRV
jgi:hypothetical protein